MDEAKLIEALRLGVRMRRAQSAFFRAGNPTDRAKALALSKKLEKEFDDTSKYLIGLHEGQQSPSPE